MSDAMLQAGERARARMPASTQGAVRVQAPARLHLGFLDPGASLGRRFGSVGLVLDGPATVLELRAALADRFTASQAASHELPRLRSAVAALRRATGCEAPVHGHLLQALAPHGGLGSGTQMALAAGHAFSALFGLGLDSRRIAALLGRGERSGVGIAGFDRGGLLVDGGPRADGSPAALVARHELPPDWRVILVLDARLQGLHGPAERHALAGLAPLPRPVAAELCHEVLMQVLPGAAGGEFAPFAAGISRMQRLLGRHFGPAQGGSPFSSPAVGRVVEWIQAHECAGCGQSSWGPTGFAIVASAQAARDVLGAARAAGVVDAALEIRVVAPRNHGALVEPVAPGRPAGD